MAKGFPVSGSIRSHLSVRRTSRSLAEHSEEIPVIVYHVEFEPGGGPTGIFIPVRRACLITEGRIGIQKWGEAAQEVGAGDAVMIAPKEKHWHCAAAGERGVHRRQRRRSTGGSSRSPTRST